MLVAFTKLVIRKRKVVFALWLMVIVLGLISGPHLDSRLTTSLAIPGSLSAEADDVLTKHFDENIEGTFTVIYPFKEASTVQIAKFETKIASAAGVIPNSSVSQEKALGGTLFANIETPFSLAKAAIFTSDLRTALKSAGLPRAMVTGPPAIESDVIPILNSDLRRGELIGILCSLLLLILVLGFTFEVLIPYIFALGSISASIGFVFLIAQKFLVVLYIPNIVELIGLGLAIDYSLLMLFRYRHEMQLLPEQPVDAIANTVTSAGKTIAISALTVAIGLASLTLVPIPFVRSLGFASVLVPLISLVAAFTLQPALLSLLKPSRRSLKQPVQPFRQIALFIAKKPLTIAISSLVVLSALAVWVFSFHITPSSLTAIPQQLESQKAISAVTSTVGPGVITPNELVVQLGVTGNASDSAVIQARSALATSISKNREVFLVADGNKPPYVDSSGKYLRLFVVGRHSFGTSESQNLVKELRDIDLTQFGFQSGSHLFVGGAAAQGVDLLRGIVEIFPWITLLVLFLIFLLLLRAFKSVVLPLKAIALDVISLLVSFGVVTLAVGTRSISHLFGLYQLNQIEAWAALFLLVLLFGVSMDYEVFIISRIKELKDQGLSNNEAIIEGIAQTGIIVTTAALIFISAVSGFIFGHFAGLQEIGIGLGFGVFIDATIIRGLLLPSVMVLLGNWNWWLPHSIARSKKTSPAPHNDGRS